MGLCCFVLSFKGGCALNQCVCPNLIVMHGFYQQYRGKQSNIRYYFFIIYVKYYANLRK